MKSNQKFFKKSKFLPVDNFFENILYDNQFGYYATKQPFGRDGDFITSPKVSNLFSEIIAIWLINTWENFGKPKKFNFVELGPGDGSLTKTLLNTFKKFPEFNSVKKIYLYEKSNYLQKIQERKIADKSVKWIKDFNNIKDGPVIFFGNEFLDAIPIKQFRKKNGSFFEKNYILNDSFDIEETFRKVSNVSDRMLKSYSSIKDLNFIEFPKLGFIELKKIIKKILRYEGCILLIAIVY